MTRTRFQESGEGDQESSVFTLETFCVDTFQTFPSRHLLNTVSAALDPYGVNVGLKEDRPQGWYIPLH